MGRVKSPGFTESIKRVEALQQVVWIYNMFMDPHTSAVSMLYVRFYINTLTFLNGKKLRFSTDF